MTNASLQGSAAQKEKMANILFWVFIIIFSLTALLALSSLIYVIYFIGTDDAVKLELVERFTWALWGAVLSQVAAGIFALYRDVFGLSTAGAVTDVSNSLTEVIDGLESNEIISEEIASALRTQYSDKMGVSGAVKN